MSVERSIDHPGAAVRYLRHVGDLVDRILAEELPAIRAAAGLCAGAITGGGLIHVLGTGHSHMLAEELFYRAGGLAAVNPILVDRLMLHAGAIDSTRLERLTSTGEEVLAELTLSRGDAMIVASNSGGNAVCDVVAAGAKLVGVRVIAIISRSHAAASSPLPSDVASGLLDVADVIIDNHGAMGDAAIEIAGVGRPAGPTSTVAGAAIVNAIAVETAELLAAQGFAVGVLASSNVEGGDDLNAELLAPYRGRVKSL